MLRSLLMMKALSLILLLTFTLTSAAATPLMIRPGELLLAGEFGQESDSDAEQLKLRKETVAHVENGSLVLTPPRLVPRTNGKKTKWGDSNFARAGLVGLPADFIGVVRWKYLKPKDPVQLAEGLVYIDLGHRMIRVTFNREGAVLMLENHLVGRNDGKPAIVLSQDMGLKLQPDHWYDIVAEVKGDEVLIQIDNHVLYGQHELIAAERYDTFNIDATGDGFLIDRIEVHAAGEFRADWPAQRTRLQQSP